MKKIFWIIILFLSFNVCYAADGSGGTSSGNICPMGVPTHKIIYNSNGGSAVENDYVSSMRPADTSLPIPTRDGYSFGGWYYDTDFTKKVDVESYFDIPFTRLYDENGCTIAATTVLYAKWLKSVTSETVVVCPMGTSPYKIIYNTNGGNSVDPFTHCGGCAYSTKPLIPTPVRKGYKFAGWYYDSKLTKKVSTNYATSITYTKKYNDKGCQIQATVNLYAKWVKEEVTTDSTTETETACPTGVPTFKVIFNTNGGNEIEPYIHCSNCKPKDKMPKPTRKDYNFEGWYYDSAYTKKVSVDDIRKITYTQRYDENGCVLLTEVILYAKWSKLDNVVIPDTAIKNNTTVVYNTMGGNSLLNDIICHECEKKTKLDRPNRKGYKFKGWYYDKDYKYPVTVDYIEDLESEYVVEDKSIVLYAKWSKNNVETSIISIIAISVGVGTIIGGLFVFMIKKKKNRFVQKSINKNW